MPCLSCEFTNCLSAAVSLASEEHNLFTVSYLSLPAASNSSWRACPAGGGAVCDWRRGDHIFCAMA